MIEMIIASVPLAIIASTPLLLAVQGELVVQRSGMINLGIEGMMLGAALSAVLAGHASGSIAVAYAGGIAGAALVALVFGVLSIGLRADQIVTGTAVNLLALGLTSFVFRELRQTSLLSAPLPRQELDFVLPIAWMIVPVLLGVFLWRSDTGLRLRACGEYPDAVQTAGFPVIRYRSLALAIQAVLAGVGGAYLAIAMAGGFGENMTAGRGYIALSIVIFGRWKLKGALAGTAIFGLAAAAQYAIQATSVGVPFHLLLALPYAVTLLILCGITGRVRPPESLGRS